jgi:cytochrome c oxidase assembly protein subunit 15
MSGRDETMNRAARIYRRLVPAATVLTLCVVVLGAWVRLTDAGLGCPDWPGCYGTLTVPKTAEQMDYAAGAFPERPVDHGKAWREMIHRYFAGALGLLVFAIAAAAWANRRDPQQPVRLPLALAGIIIAQSLLGMWTVTLLLKPFIVTLHLLGGLTTLGLLFWLTLDIVRPRPAIRVPRRLPALGLAALLLLGVQITLGGWTSTNYAALACPDFPTCQTQWWPEMDFAEGFRPWHGLGIDYEGGILDSPARTAIHYVHRLGAVVVTLALGGLALAALAGGRPPPLRRAGGFLLGALAVQVAIGIGIIHYSLPLSLATAHNAGAALLLLALLNYNHLVRHAEH